MPIHVTADLIRSRFAALHHGHCAAAHAQTDTISRPTLPGMRPIWVAKAAPLTVTDPGDEPLVNPPETVEIEAFQSSIVALTPDEQAQIDREAAAEVAANDAELADYLVTLSKLTAVSFVSDLDSHPIDYAPDGSGVRKEPSHSMLRVRKNLPQFPRAYTELPNRLPAVHIANEHEALRLAVIALP